MLAGCCKSRPPDGGSAGIDEPAPFDDGPNVIESGIDGYDGRWGKHLGVIMILMSVVSLRERSAARANKEHAASSFCFQVLAALKSQPSDWFPLALTGQEFPDLMTRECPE